MVISTCVPAGYGMTILWYQEDKEITVQKSRCEMGYSGSFISGSRSSIGRMVSACGSTSSEMGTGVSAVGAGVGAWLAGGDCGLPRGSWSPADGAAAASVMSSFCDVSRRILQSVPARPTQPRRPLLSGGMIGAPQSQVVAHAALRSLQRERRQCVTHVAGACRETLLA